MTDQRRNQAREENRRKAPNVADIVDTFEAAFGKVKVIAAEDYETGAKFGTFGDERNPSS